jgi:hypothetical protein
MNSPSSERASERDKTIMLSFMLFVTMPVKTSALSFTCWVAGEGEGEREREREREREVY